MEFEEIKMYISAGIFGLIGFAFLIGGLFFAVIDDWNFGGFNGVNLITGLIFLAFATFFYFEAKGRTWAKTAQMILLIIIGLFILISIIAGVIITQ